MGKVLLEVCVDSCESARAAIAGGAERLELCSALSEGGLTPSPGLLYVVKQTFRSIPAFVMLRPRRGDFCYEEDWYQIHHDIDLFKKEGADGFVFGALTPAGEIDEDLCARVIRLAGGLPVTFHRAFDLTKEVDFMKNCSKIANLGFTRLLTSGFRSSAEEGIDVIRVMNEKFGEKLTIMPGAGITEENIRKIADETKCREIHASARRPKNQEQMRISMGGNVADKEPQMVTSSDVVRQMVLNLLQHKFPPQHVICH
ncbi:copper homeostasis protein cutC homolog [Lutzomyia longipalpis]|uniref:Copper homeostasis protein cutC homolog n=1 Tax=Lutzomyia longipalpis TaxID=7200 RepID=A0A7G3AHX6_LUTLO|nr:copper homeostasis protein cutC homolog [Lutzomyia longipalpis]